MVFLLADSQPPVDRATTTAVGDLRQIAALLEGLAGAGLGARARRRAGAGHGFGDRGQRCGARLHHARAGESDELEFKMARGRGHTTLSGVSFATSRKIPEEVFRTGEPRIVADLLDGELASMHMHTVALGIRNVLCVPLRLVRYVDKAEAVGEERRIGVLYLDSKEKGRSSRAPPAPRSRRSPPKRPSPSRMPGSIARRWKRRGWSRRCGSPPRSSRRCCRKPARVGSYFRAAAASLPCRSIGGDFYDYVDMSGGALGFALGDVAGKGPPAALLSAMMQGIFAAQAASSDRPSQTIARVNLALYRRGIESRFVTLMYGVLAPTARSSTATPATIRRSSSASGSGVRRLDRGGPIVGLFETATYEDEEAAPCARGLAHHVQRRRLGSAVGRRRGIRRRADRRRASRTTCTRAARGSSRRSSRTSGIRQGRRAERRHHRHGAPLRRMP